MTLQNATLTLFDDDDNEYRCPDVEDLIMGGLDTVRTTTRISFAQRSALVTNDHHTIVNNFKYAERSHSSITSASSAVARHVIALILYCHSANVSGNGHLAKTPPRWRSTGSTRPCPTRADTFSSKASQNKVASLNLYFLNH